MTTTEQITPGPIDWSLPVQIKFHQLQAVRHAATRAGFYIAQLKRIAGGYEIKCERRGS